MRRILVENARRKASVKHGGGRLQVELDASALAAPQPPDEILALDDALTKLATVDESAARLVHLHHFAGQTLDEAADLLEIPSRSADRLWTYAKAWLHRELLKSDDSK
jgi:RNA polymerase sigma factor (TIGR02999 family)